jgi:hypothetical protein
MFNFTMRVGEKEKMNCAHELKAMVKDTAQFQRNVSANNHINEMEMKINENV